MSEDTPTNGAALSWRDVYKAVGESEGRVVAAINDLGSRLGASVSDHEARIRAVEAQTALVGPLKVEETALSLRVTALETHNSRESGVFATFSGGQKAIVTLIVVASFLITISGHIH